MSRILIVASVLLSAGIAFASPAAAKEASDEGGERINQLIVYGDDPCPPSSGNEITVCARKDESERYRIPEILRDTDTQKNEAWNNKVLAYETIGKTGTLSCSPVGPGGSTGCMSKLINAAYEEKGMDPSLHFSELIAEERAKRLSTIDEDAAATQKRVEQAEREYEARQRREQESQDKSTSAQGQ